MVSRIVGDTLVHTQSCTGWELTSLEGSRGLARLEVRRDRTRIVVADTGDVVAGVDEPFAFSAVACTSDGELVVTTRRAPPAIMLGASGCRTTPADGSARDSTFPEPGERFLLLSCAAFENMPDVLAKGIKQSPSDLIAQDPQDLLLAIFADRSHGAGAVIDRRPAHCPTGARP